MGLDDNFKNVFTNWYSNEHKEVIFFRENAMDKTVETAKDVYKRQIIQAIKVDKKMRLIMLYY